jgi:hypothetical protein
MITSGTSAPQSTPARVPMNPSPPIPATASPAAAAAAASSRALSTLVVCTMR